MTQEKWRPVPSCLGYSASNLGRIKSDRTGKLLHGSIAGSGYRYVTLRIDGKRAYRTAHAMVAEAFYGPRPEGQEVRHLDGSRTNNVVENLRWGTAAENAADKLLHGTHPGANKTHCPQGHSYAGENLYVEPKSGARVCRTCRRERQKEYQARRRIAASFAAANIRTERAA